MADPDDRAWFWPVFVACAAMSLVPLWAVKYVPMVDLPQHAAQISIWKNLNDPNYGFAPYFELHYFTPYLVTYALARVLAEWTSVLVALKVATSLSVLGLPASLVLFFGRANVSRWWALLGFSLAFGFSFDWGFLSFMMGIAIAFVYLAVVISYARAPTVTGEVLVGMFTLALFWVHLVLLLFCACAAAVIILGLAPDLRATLRRVLSLVLPIPIAVAWLFVDRHQVQDPLVWNVGLHRIVYLFTLSEWLTLSLWRFRPLAVALILLGAVIIRLRARGDRGDQIVTYLPFALTAAFVVLWPEVVFGTRLIAPRFTVFLLPFFIAWLRPAAPRVLRAALVAGTAAWMTVLMVRFRAFDADARDYEAVATAMVPRARIRPLTFVSSDDDVFFLHFPAWTQADKGGLCGFSFAAAYPVVRYRPGVSGLMEVGAEWLPEEFDWRREVAVYDYYVVRSPMTREALSERLFKGAGDSIAFVAEKGMWHIYGARHR
jgi:hypothetical protein